MKKNAFTLVELLVVIAIIGVLIALLLPAVQAAREAARRMQCTNHLKQVGIAVHNFHDVQKGLPPACIGWKETGDPETDNAKKFGRASFWVLIMPYLEKQSLYDFIGTKSNSLAWGLTNGTLWNSCTVEEQQSLLSVSFYLCPSRRSSMQLPSQTPTTTDSINGIFGTLSDYAIVAGRNESHWSGWLQVREPTDTSGNSDTAINDSVRLCRGPFRCAIWNNNSPGSWKARDNFSRMADGTSNQIITGEKRLFQATISECRADNGNGQSDRAYFGDCSILPGGTWATYAGGRSFNAHFGTDINKEVEANHAETGEHWGSSHSGVCNFLLGDGAVKAVSVTTPTGALVVGGSGTLNANSIIAKLGNVADGNSVSLP